MFDDNKSRSKKDSMMSGKKKKGFFSELTFKMAAEMTALLILYILASVVVIMAARSQKIIHFGGYEISFISFAGVFTSLANICVILLVVYYKRYGFLLSILILFYQFPKLMIDIVSSHTISSLPGLFSNALTLIAVIMIHISSEKADKYTETIREQAVTDRLTGLPNRYACSQYVKGLTAQGRSFAVVSIDINGFKGINETMGNETGNKVLIEISSRWRTIAETGLSGTNDSIGRMSGDEFILIVCGFSSEEDVKKTIALYEAALGNKMTIEDCDLFITASFGYTVYPTDAEKADSLVTYAYDAVRELKRRNSSEHILRFTRDLINSERNLEIEQVIRIALEKDTVYYNLQPQYDIRHKLRGFEALARIKDENGRNISPGEFIPVAEKLGLIDKLDFAVFRKTAMFFGRLIKQTGSNITLSVNVSVRHLMKNDFLEEIRSVLEESGLPAGQLEIEITESIMIDSVEKALQCISDIKDMGIKIAIDDFGTGYSSLSYLNKFPADLLKVDKSFIDKMNLSDSSKQYVAAIISIGHIMNFDVIAEGVEEPDQLETLREIGCDYIQGFIWGRPLPQEEAEQLVISSVGK